jgi:hypothetical protein
MMKRFGSNTSSTRQASPAVAVARASAPLLQRLGNRRAAQLVTAQLATPVVQRRRGVDATAQAIIDAAKDTSAQPSAEKRAIAAVWAIVRTYYADQVGKVKDVTFRSAEHGLNTTSQGRGATTTGIIEVGSYFLDHIDDFAHRVLQVGHELQHVDQYRTGMTGHDKSPQREFLAYYWEAMQAEKAGTGHMSAATRRAIIDGALGNFLCLTSDDQATFADKRDELRAKRRTVDGKKGNDPVPEPTECKPVG